MARVRHHVVIFGASAILALFAGCDGGGGGGGGDTTPPSVDNIVCSPTLALTGETITITFTVSEPLTSNPTVTVDGKPAAFVSESYLDYTYTYVVQGTETEGDVSVWISVTDLAGLSVGVTATVALDCRTPEFVVYPLTPGPGPFGPGQTFTIEFDCSEPLPANPTVTVEGNPASLVSLAGLRYCYSYTVLGTEGQENATLSIVGTDAAGRTGTATEFVMLDLTGRRSTSRA